MTDAPPEGIERRRHPRFDLFAQVRVKRAQEDIVVELANISASGALMHVGRLARPSWIAVGRVLEIGIVHPIDLDTVDLRGRVVRVAEDVDGISVAVTFEDPDQEDHRGIARLLETAKSERPKPPPLPEG